MLIRLFLNILLSFLLITFSLNGQIVDSFGYSNYYQKHINAHVYGDSLDASSRLAGLSRAWAEARFNFANFDQIPDLNWDSLYLEFIPKVLNTNSDVEFYKLLTRFYTHLKDGHSMVVAPFSLWDSLYAALPIEAQLIDGHVVIRKNYSQLPEYKLLAPGTIIKKINEQDIHDYVSKQISPFVSYSSAADSISRLFSHLFTRGHLEDSLKLELLNRNNNLITASFPRMPQAKLNSLIHKGSITFNQLGNQIGLLSIPDFSQQNQTLFLDSIFNTLPSDGGLIIDLRGNNSGLLFNAYELLAYLHQEIFIAETIMSPIYYPARRARQQNFIETEIFTNLRTPYWGTQFEGPIVILIDGHTHGNSEIFLASLTEQKNVHLIGSTTAGASGQSLYFRLPSEGMGFISAKRNLTSDKKEYYRKGFQADLEIKTSLAQFLSDEDPVLKAAIEYLRKELNK